jgi:hypothetical protein
MPKIFSFESLNPTKSFSCVLNSTQCTSKTKTGIRCKRKCITPFEFCPTHLALKTHLKVRNSTIPGAGKGLFAFNYGDKLNKTIVFHTNETIISYNGENVSQSKLNKRYGNKTGPYALCFIKNRRSTNCIDAACLRGAASFINSPSSSRFQSNASLEFDANQKIFFIVAERDIKNGEEIFWEYSTSVTPNDKSYQLNEQNVTFSTKPYYPPKKKS